RRASLIGTVLLDVAALFGFRDLYGDMRNDLLAVGVSCPVLHVGSGLGRYVKPAIDSRWEYDVDYTDELGNEPVVPHHAESLDDELLAHGLWWELLAVSAVLRD